jgi:hypothetical protein
MVHGAGRAAVLSKSAKTGHKNVGTLGTLRDIGPKTAIQGCQARRPRGPSKSAKQTEKNLDNEPKTRRVPRGPRVPCKSGRAELVRKIVQNSTKILDSYQV